MNTKKFSLLIIFLSCISLTEQPLQASAINNTPTANGLLTPNMQIAAMIYFGYNYLSREEFLVKNKAPYAQLWYEYLTTQHAPARLDTKKFLQTPKLNPIADTLADYAKRINWISGSQHIYLSEDALKEITYLYKKVVDGYPLSEQEQAALARQEFTVLRQAAHIEYNHAQIAFTAITGLFATIKGLEYAYPTITTIEQTEGRNILVGHELPTEFNINLPKNPLQEKLHISLPQVPTMLTTAQGCGFITSIITLLRYQESQADKFACELMDTQTLKLVVTLFENNEVDPLYGLENKTITPFVKTDSFIGTLIQSIINPIEYACGYAWQQTGLAIRSNSYTYWLYHFLKNPIQQEPSARAQAIKNEIMRREK